jgi:hypothetical protein
MTAKPASWIKCRFMKCDCSTGPFMFLFLTQIVSCYFSKEPSENIIQVVYGATPAVAIRKFLKRWMRL